MSKAVRLRNIVRCPCPEDHTEPPPALNLSLSELSGFGSLHLNCAFAIRFSVVICVVDLFNRPRFNKVLQKDLSSDLRGAAVDE
jgi:hypothetical protein